MMWFDIFRLILFGLCAGLITSCGYFSLFIAVGVINRFVQFTHTADKIRHYENMVIAGVFLGSFVCLINPFRFLPGVFWIVFMLFSGCFSGCFLLSLSEAVKGVPVFARRVRLTTGFTIILFFLALGKGLGTLFYFLF